MKKRFLSVGAVALLAVPLLYGCSADQKTSQDANAGIGATKEEYKRIEGVSPEEALKLLKEGNERMVSDEALVKDSDEETRTDLLDNGQTPFAVVLSCSDSRVPPEIIFDQGLGDLFVVRNAGNILEPSSLASVEYGAYKLGSPLIVVLGHEDCGAVAATVSQKKTGTDIDFIIDRLTPVLESNKGDITDEKELAIHIEDANIAYQKQELEKNPVIKKLIDENKLRVVGAKYDLDTGKVEFFE